MVFLLFFLVGQKEVFYDEDDEANGCRQYRFHHRESLCEWGIGVIFLSMISNI